MKKINDVFEYIFDIFCIFCEVKFFWFLRYLDIVEIKNILFLLFKKEFKDIYVFFEQMELNLYFVIKVNEDLKQECYQFYFYEGFVF